MSERKQLCLSGYKVVFCSVWKAVTLSCLLEKQNSVHDAVQPFGQVAATADMCIMKR